MAKGISNKATTESMCFVIGPIGEEGSSDRKHADLLLNSVIKEVLEDTEFRYNVKRADEGRIASQIELHDAAAKKGSGRTIPMHPVLGRTLSRLQRPGGRVGAVIQSERGSALRPSSVVNWFARLYQDLKFDGCSSHSGRRTFITNASRLVFKAGGSLRDVQQLAGHRSIEHTQAYIDGDTRVKRRLVNLL
jgi:integrase/recombinase XerD